MLSWSLIRKVMHGAGADMKTLYHVARAKGVLGHDGALATAGRKARLLVKLARMLGHEKKARSIDEMVDRCLPCPKMCRHACPVAIVTGRESDTSSGLALSHRLLAEKKIPLSDVVTAAYAHTEDGAYREYCPLGVDITAIARDLKQQCFSRLAPKEVRKRLHAIRETSYYTAEHFGSATSNILFFGHALIADAAMADVRAVLACQGISYSTLMPEPTSGYEAGFYGATALQAELNEGVKAAIRSYELVISSDPATVMELRALRANVKHIAEVLDPEKVKEGRLKGKNVTYHDDPILGRQLGVYDQPRALLEAAGATIIEPYKTRQLSECAGASIRHINPKLAAALAKRRADDLRHTGADLYVTSCPGAKDLLQHYLPVEDLAEALR